jgi:hypothetical protein
VRLHAARSSNIAFYSQPIPQEKLANLVASKVQYAQVKAIFEPRYGLLVAEFQVRTCIACRSGLRWMCLE